jgi:hypothetical protein
MWAANIRPLATILGHEYVLSFYSVSRVWRLTGGSTTTAMFIADAWADFSYFGMISYSIFVGMVCRAIDNILLVRGKTVIAVTTLAAAFIGIYNLMISALPTSMLSGGLILPPVIVIMILEIPRSVAGRYGHLTKA